MASLFPRTSDCSEAVQWYTNKGRWSWFPALGAQVMYGENGGDEHTGIIIAYDPVFIWAVEANTSDNGSTEGDGVYIRKRRRSDAIVYGYGLPAYAEGIYTADTDLKGKAGYIYQASHAGPGPAELTAGVSAVQNLVAESATVNGALNSGRNFIQQNDAFTLALEVAGFTTANGTPQLILVKDADGIARFEITAQGALIHRGTSSFSANVQLGSATADTGGGSGVVGIANALTVPASNASSGGVLYAQGGALKWRGSNGTITTIAPA
ncbi:hypothetical protein ACFY5K_25660 [Streptomyces griseofuscus]|uniref:hypothetical protein n=1 Tax=Streptomyces griseofuscus TaxID=146922 RepID=UPI0036771898